MNSSSPTASPDSDTLDAQNTFSAWLLYLLWKLLTFGVVAPIYLSVIADGLRTLVPVLGQKLHKLPIPGFASFAKYVDTRRLDLATFLALVLLGAVWWLWEQILAVYLRNDVITPHGGWNSAAYRRVVVTLGVIILGADALLFGTAVSNVGWGDSEFSGSAFLATVAYVAVIVFISLVSLKLRPPSSKR
jgi:hypothetical protein